MKLVRQRAKQDCGVAVLAMLIGSTYEEAGTLMRDPEPNGGLTWWDINQGLAAAGYAVATWWKASGCFYYSRPLVNLAFREFAERAWPPRPFAPAHYFQRDGGTVSHFLAADRRGRVFDPSSADTTRLISDEDPERIVMVTGVWPIRPVPWRSA